jgi:hypothetical protein
LGSFCRTGPSRGGLGSFCRTGPPRAAAWLRSAETARSFEGGALQLIIPVVDTNRQINSALAALITRKLMTSQLTNKPSLLLENPWVTAQRQKGRNI